MESVVSLVIIPATTSRVVLSDTLFLPTILYYLLTPDRLFFVNYQEKTAAPISY